MSNSSQNRQQHSTRRKSGSVDPGARKRNRLGRTHTVAKVQRLERDVLDMIARMPVLSGRRGDQRDILTRQWTEFRRRVFENVREGE